MININTDNQFTPDEIKPTPKPCVIAPRTKESERYLWNQGEIHWLLFVEGWKQKAVAWKFNIWQGNLMPTIKYYTETVPSQLKWREEKAIAKFNE